MIIVSGAGLSSPLGTLAGAAAAARARLDQRVSLDMVLPNPGEEDPSEVAGHVHPDVQGAEDYGRLIALLVPAVVDAIRSSGMPPSPPPVVFVVLPEEDTRAALSNIDLPEDQFPQGADAFVIERLKELVDGLGGARITLLRGGHAAAIDAIAQARALLEGRHAERVIVCAADSLVDPETAAALAGSGRVRHSAQADGFYPGEAAAAFVLELDGTAQRRGAQPLARLGAVLHRPAPPAPLLPARPEPPEPADAPEAAEGEGEEEGGPEEPEEVEPPWTLDGTLLCDALLELHRQDAPAVLGASAILDEFNGESVRARYFWTNLLRAGAREKRLRALVDLPRWVLAESFGDVGAATPLVQLGIAIRAFARGYAPGPSFLLCDTADSGATGLLVVSRP